MCQAYKTPVQELLRAVPFDARIIWTEESGLKATHMCPIGKHSHDAADMIEHFQAENQRLREELAKREWQPIETAPKDGTSIILHIQKHNETYYDCKWGPYGFETYEWDGESYDWSPILSSASLTHWMPLPEPPKEDA